MLHIYPTFVGSVLNPRLLLQKNKKYVLIILTLTILTPVNMQFACPPPVPMLPMVPQAPIAMFPPPLFLSMPHPMMPMPLPIPPPIIGIIPAPIKVEETTSTTSTTTTTTQRSHDCESPDNSVYPQPVPFGVQIAMSALHPPKFCTVRNKPVPCPPCPPCVCAPLCTPSFFSYCSPCHLKCRCRDGMDVPTPIPPIAPAPVPGPAYAMPVGLPPTAVIPHPPYPKISVILLKDKNDEESDGSSDEDELYLRSGKSYHKHFRRLKKLSKRLNSLRS